MTKILLTAWRWRLALLMLASNSMAPLHAQTRLDPSYGPMQVYQPATAAQALVLGTGERLVLGSNMIRAERVFTPQRLVRYSAAGVFDAGFAAVTAAYAWSPLGLVDGGAGRVLVSLGGPSNLGGQTYFGLVRLLPSGAVDGSFAAQPGNLNVSSMLMQPDNKLVVVGGFTSYGLQPAGGLVRLNDDGTLDITFLLNTAGGLGGQTFRPVLALQPQDGKIVVGGSFRQAAGQARSALARFNPDGSLDAAFAPPTTAAALVGSVAVQPDGRILAGSFNNVPIVANVTQMLVRFTATGAFDNSFAGPNLGVRPAFSGGATTLLVQPDGKILFAFSNGVVPPGSIVRLTGSGTTDPTWNIPIAPAFSAPVNSLQLLAGGQVVFAGSPQPLVSPTSVGTGVGQLTSTGDPDLSVSVPLLQAAGLVRDMALQPDGKLLVVGTFTEINGSLARGLARLNSAGSVDVAYTNAVVITGGFPTKVVLQANGSALVAGRFRTLGGVTVPSLARVMSTGALDPGFAPALFSSASINVNSVSAIAVQPDGRVLLAGGLQQTNGGSFRNFLRLLPTGGSDASFQPASGLLPAALLVEPNGGIVLGNTDRQMPAVQRLLPSGAPDPTFAAPAGPPVGTAFGISGLSRYADGRLLVFGNFSELGGHATQSIARLASNGAVDLTFSSGLTGLAVIVQVAVVQPNGRIMAGGTIINPGAPNANLFRLLPNGANDFTLNAALNPGAVVSALAIEPSGALLVGGQFTDVSGQFQVSLTRLLDANVLHMAVAQRGLSLEAWPVPAHDELNLRLDAANRPVEVELRDALGRAVLTQAIPVGSTELRLNVRPIPAGVYLLRVRYATGAAASRHVVLE